MSENVDRPFVPRRGVPINDKRPPTPSELANMRAELHRTPRPATKSRQPVLTDTESAAIARKRLEESRQP